MNTEIINQIIEMLKAGASYSQIQNKLNVYPVQIKRIKDKFININNNNNDSANTKNNNNNDSANNKNNNTNISSNREEELKFMLRHKQGELLKLQQQHEIEIKNLKIQLQRQHEIEVEQIETQKDEIELENFAIQLKRETELKKMQEKLEQVKKETKPDETEEEDEPAEPEVDDVVVWKNKNIEGRIENIKGNIAEVEFDTKEYLIEIPFNQLIDDNGDVWIYDDSETHSLRSRLRRRLRRRLRNR